MQPKSLAEIAAANQRFRTLRPKGDPPNDPEEESFGVPLPEEEEEVDPDFFEEE